MTRIFTNTASMVAQNRLSRSNDSLQTALSRLSTGVRINNSNDDPAGVIASGNLRSEITSLNSAIGNARRANSIIGTVDGALGEVNNLLNDIRGLVVEASNSGALSDEEIAANQLQIDGSLEAINRISQTTTFQGRKLLDGSLDFVHTAENVDSILDLDIQQANLGQSGKIDIEVEIESAAEQASISTSSNAFTAAADAFAEIGSEKGFFVGDGTNTDSVDVYSTTETINAINFVDDAGASGETAQFDQDTGVVTVTGQFTGGDITATEIANAINTISGLSAEASSTTVTAATIADTTDGGSGVPDNPFAWLTAIGNPGSQYNNVEIEVVDIANAGIDETVTASFDEGNKRLTFTTNSLAATSTNKDFQAFIDAVATVVDENGDQRFGFGYGGGAGKETSEFTAKEGLTYSTGNTGGELLKDDVVFQLTGNGGAETFNFTSATSSALAVKAINQFSDSTGITASYDSASGLTFQSVEYGSNQAVEIDVIVEGESGEFESGFANTRGTGQDVSAKVNGVKADVDGNRLGVNTGILDLQLTIADGSNNSFQFEISGGGTRFQIGPTPTTTQQAQLGIGSVSTGQLGGISGRLYELSSGESKSLANDPNGAAQVLDEAIEKVASLRGRLGAFQSTTLESGLISLTDARSNLQNAESSINDADFAQESASLTRAQILVQSGSNVLSIANQNPQNVLSLLR